MASGVVDSTISVHQSLHGYADGHRLLASSISLRNRDAKVVLTLSDASGSVANIDDAGYVTGYPLSEAGVYALARTWPAPEMPRPGCVWTHTLFIEFADLALIDNLAWIANAFVRPQIREPRAHAYSVQLSLTAGEPVARGDTWAGDDYSLRQKLIWSLYQYPRERIFSAEVGDLADKESAAFDVWSQQWPRLRRSFRFCTFISSDRSTEAAPFDLQFGSKDERSLRSRSAKLLDADREAYDATAAWLSCALSDLKSSGPLRSFLRALGAELNGGREAFVSLCEMYVLLHSVPANTEAIGRAIELFEGPLRSAEAREARAQLVRCIADLRGDIDEQLFRFFLEQAFVLSEEEFHTVASRFLSAQWRHEPGRVLRMLTEGGKLSLVAAHVVAGEPPPSVVASLAQFPEFASTAFHQFPQMLCQSDVWRNETLEGAALQAALANESISASVLDAMIDGGRKSIAHAVCDAFGATTILEHLSLRLRKAAWESLTESEIHWISAAASPNAVAIILSREKPISLSTVALLMRNLSPDDIPNEYGEDPVFTALRHKAGELSPVASLFVYSWVLCRALGHRSRNQADLIAQAFDVVYQAALDSRLPSDSWQLLERRLPNSMLWQNWDRGRRIRVGIVTVFVERFLDPYTFGQIVLFSEELFAGIASEALWLWGGRTYLRSVQSALEKADPQRFAERIATLSDLV